MSFKILLKAFLIVVLSSHCFVSFAHSGGQSHNAKKWYFQDSDVFVEADFVSSVNGIVTLSLADQYAIVKYPLESFSMEDQLIIMERLALIEKFNQPSKVNIKSGINQTTQLNNSKVWISLLSLMILII